MDGLAAFLGAAATFFPAGAGRLPAAPPTDQVVTYPAPPGIPANERFTVKVRSPGGGWKDGFCYLVEVDTHPPRLKAQ